MSSWEDGGLYGYSELHHLNNTNPLRFQGGDEAAAGLSFAADDVLRDEPSSPGARGRSTGLSVESRRAKRVGQLPPSPPSSQTSFVDVHAALSPLRRGDHDSNGDEAGDAAVRTAGAPDGSGVLGGPGPDCVEEAQAQRSSGPASHGSPGGSGGGGELYRTFASGEEPVSPRKSKGGLRRSRSKGGGVGGGGGGSVRSSFKNRVLSMVNNVRHTQMFKVKFSTMHSAWILGTMFHEKIFESEAAAEDEALLDETSNRPHMVAMFNVIKSLVYCSYRQGFANILDSQHSTDVGWGCMLRSGQMLLCSALQRHLLEPGWLYRPGMLSAGIDYHREIIRLVDDQHASHCPFSVHHLLGKVAGNGIRPGDWLGPTSTARALCTAINENPAALADLRPLRAYLVNDRTLYTDEVEETIEASGLPWCPVFFVVPMRLGHRSMSKAVANSLKALFTCPLCLGFMGGRPKHSLYFIGFQGTDLVGLDPHISRNVVDMSSTSFPTESYHTTQVRKVPLSNLDPSLALGFYCATREDLDAFYAFIADNVSGGSPLFTIAEHAVR